ncbi:hypothetical protein [Streptomyces sp. NPDC058989]|uniref:hypothetical protein n=1 Tax=Streptomyces sp. NPDC058989 TaxID=3346686 RepID=UPI00368027EE
MAAALAPGFNANEAADLLAWAVEHKATTQHIEKAVGGRIQRVSESPLVTRFAA